MAQSAPRPLFEQVLDYALYVPLGAALRLAEQVPGLAAGGRALAGRQVDNARAVGRFAFVAARRQIDERLKRADAVRHGDSAVDTAPMPAPTRASRAAPRTSASTRDSAVPDADGLAVPGYDALAASQVLPLLEGLSAAELEAVRLYEAAHRHRRTVLGRIAQLDGESRDGDG